MISNIPAFYALLRFVNCYIWLVWLRCCGWFVLWLRLVILAVAFTEFHSLWGDITFRNIVPKLKPHFALWNYKNCLWGGGNQISLLTTQFNKTENVLWRNVEARSCNHCFSGKAISISYSECVCVCVCSLGYPACNAYAPYCCLLWRVQLYNIFPHYLINGTIFEKKNMYRSKKVCFDFLYTFVWNIFCTLLSETFSVHFCLKHFLYTFVWNIFCTLLSETYSVHFCLKHFLYTFVWNIFCTLLSETFSVHFCLKHFSF